MGANMVVITIATASDVYISFVMTPNRTTICNSAIFSSPRGIMEIPISFTSSHVEPVNFDNTPHHMNFPSIDAMTIEIIRNILRFVNISNAPMDA